MATFQKRAGRVTATVRIKPHPAKSATFDTVREAKKWAAETELKFRNEKKGTHDHISMLEALEVYRDTVVVKKEGAVKERNRINFTIKRLEFDFSIADTDKEFWVNYRELRLEEVSSSTVRRDLNVFKAFFAWCVEIKLWLKESPMADVKLPADSDHRERVIQPDEIESLLPHLDEELKIIFLLALETGMRLGEICNLTWDRCRIDQSYVYLDKTKNGRPREVPLSKAAIILIESMKSKHDKNVFNYPSSRASTEFVKARLSANLFGFTFHDTRHTAATKIAPKLPLLDLCKMFGWSDPKRAMIYYNPTSAQIASRL